MVEAAFNPMISDMYSDNKAKMLNKFHVWFPGGIAIGALLAYFAGSAGFGWQAKISIMFAPTIIYGFLFYGQSFPEPQREGGPSTADNFKAILSSPIYWFMLVCMVLTATTELGTQGWVERLLANSGAQPLLALVLITGLMAVGRYFAGPIIKKLDITGVLLASAVISVIALYMLSTVTGNMVYVAAVMFALGVCYFWPNMISFVATYLPKTGALGMSLIGGVGMLGLSIFQPIIGGWMDSERAYAIANGLEGDAVELAAGQATLDNIAILPALLIVAFAIIYFTRDKIKAKYAT
jgi:fucose permease